MDILYGEKFDIHSLSDLLVIMSGDSSNIDLLEEIIVNLLARKKSQGKDIQVCRDELKKIRTETVVDFIDIGSEFNDNDIDDTLDTIEKNGRKIEKILKKNNVSLLNVLVEVSKKQFQYSDERWFILPNKYSFTVLIAYIEGETHNTETFF